MFRDVNFFFRYCVDYRENDFASYANLVELLSCYDHLLHTGMNCRDKYDPKATTDMPPHSQNDPSIETQKTPERVWSVRTPEEIVTELQEMCKGRLHENDKLIAYLMRNGDYEMTPTQMDIWIGRFLEFGYRQLTGREPPELSEEYELLDDRNYDDYAEFCDSWYRKWGLSVNC